ncbi:hypothetical protein BDW74DRAFT_126047 [Aspergillus multicolor]|uniref:uncharacterized protein n=1 Tax=Aspergillus multicolor TaxID=41759 RepID=UPI003CCCA620
MLYFKRVDLKRRRFKGEHVPQPLHDSSRARSGDTPNFLIPSRAPVDSSRSLDVETDHRPVSLSKCRWLLGAQQIDDAPSVVIDRRPEDIRPPIMNRVQIKLTAQGPAPLNSIILILKCWTLISTLYRADLHHLNHDFPDTLSAETFGSSGSPRKTFRSLT